MPVFHLGFYQQNIKYFATELSEFHIQIIRNCRFRDENSGTGKPEPATLGNLPNNTGIVGRIRICVENGKKDPYQNALDPQLPTVGTISIQSINQINVVLTSAMHLRLFSAANRYLGTV